VKARENGESDAAAAEGRRRPARRRDEADTDAYADVVLDVPQLRVDEISLEVDDLRAQVALHAEVLDVLKLHVGVEAALGHVQLTIKGVDADVLLKVRLDRVAEIVDRVLSTIDRNPQILERLAEGVGGAVEDVPDGVGRAVGQVAERARPAKERPRRRSARPAKRRATE
jgi:hypothetical protein